jgi:hypothetical protein
MVVVAWESRSVRGMLDVAGRIEGDRGVGAGAGGDIWWIS